MLNAITCSLKPCFLDKIYRDLSTSRPARRPSASTLRHALLACFSWKRTLYFAGPRGALSVVRDFCMATGRVPVHIFNFRLIAR